ncbi:MAG: NADP-dependent malic enzyme [Candidatus Gracilibacteria bacterium]|nr:NADP-dependent malic enzyme [Candidatus Gracilibacteria bacterium]
MDYFKESLRLHEKWKGKIDFKSKIELNNKNDLSLAYTPGVAKPCLEIAKNPDNAYKYTIKGNTVAVISDGSAVLGLGNIGGLAGLPVMEGKCILFKEFAGVNAFPIVLDTQDTEEIIQTIKHISPTVGGINLEDISAPRCFIIEERLKEELNIPVFHDDQHGTAIVVLAGLINAIRVRDNLISPPAGTPLDKGRNNLIPPPAGTPFEKGRNNLIPPPAGTPFEKGRNYKIVVNGLGAAGTAIIKLLSLYGFEDIIVCDSKGIISINRTDLNNEKKEILKITNKNNIDGKLSDAVIGRDVFIGVSAPGVLTEEMVKSMNKDSMIFAMANPTPEIMPDIAKKAGALIVATGRSDFPNQLNNVLVFPGLFKGALKNRVIKITEQHKLDAAQALADYVNNPSVDEIIPSPLDKNVANVIASVIK